MSDSARNEQVLLTRRVVVYKTAVACASLQSTLETDLPFWVQGLLRWRALDRRTGT
jgi:hypothetical protein